MSAAQYVPARCACGAGNYLKPVSRAPTTAGEPTDQDWRFRVEPGAAPIEPPARQYRLAVHEAGHAVLAHALGRQVSFVTVEGQPHVACADAVVDHFVVAVITMGADHVERLLLHRLEYRPENPDVIASFDAIRRLEFGGCDRCGTALAIFGICGARAPDNVLLAAYRQAEADTIRILREPLIQAAIRALARVLMDAGEVNGSEAHNIIQANGVEFGSRRLTERKQRA